MKILLVLVLTSAFGCAGATKKQTRPAAALGGCQEAECPRNGTRLNGTGDATAPRVDSVTLRSGERAQTR